jgi:hypothetical protein
MMNMVTITTPTADADGAVKIRPTAKSDIKSLAARVARSQCLDGTAIVTSQGAVDGDRTIRIRGRLDRTEADRLWSIFKNNSYLQIGIDDGVFYGAMSRLEVNRGEVDFEFLIQE